MRLGDLRYDVTELPSPLRGRPPSPVFPGAIAPLPKPPEVGDASGEGPSPKKIRVASPPKPAAFVTHVTYVDPDTMLSYAFLVKEEHWQSVPMLQKLGAFVKKSTEDDDPRKLIVVARCQGCKEQVSIARDVHDYLYYGDNGPRPGVVGQWLGGRDDTRIKELDKTRLSSFGDEVRLLDTVVVVA